MPLTALQRSEIRRHLKYPNVGFVSPNLELLEDRLDNLEVCDEATLTGRAFASAVMIGQAPVAGNQVTLTFANLAGATGPLASSPYNKIVTVTSAGAGTGAKLALEILGALLVDSTLAAAGFLFSVVGAELDVTNGKAFKLTAAVSAGSLFGVSVDKDGSVLPDPSVQVGISAGAAQIVYGFLPLLNYLHSAIGTATRRQGTLQADVFKARQDEVSARRQLYEFYQRELANFLDVPINPYAQGGKSAYGQIVR